MATFRIDTPDGRSFEITGNRTPTEQEVMQMIGGQNPVQQNAQEDFFTEDFFSPEKAAERRKELGNAIKDKIQGQLIALDEGYTGGWGKKTLGRVGGAMGGIVAGIQNGGGISDIITGAKEGWNNQDKINQIKEDYEEKNPVESLGIKLVSGFKSPLFKLSKGVLGAGSVVNKAVGGGKVGQAAEFLTDVLGQAGVGAIYGNALGSGTSKDAGEYFKSDDFKKDALEGAIFQAAIPVAGKTIQIAKPLIGKGLKGVAGFLSGTGTGSIETAVKAGEKGNKVFLKNMRDKSAQEEVVGKAREELENMISSNSDLYKTNMSKAFEDTTELDVNKIYNKLDDLIAKETLGGEVPLSGDEKKVLEQTFNLLKPTQKSRVARTTLGLDKIRQKVHGITTEQGTNPDRLKKSMENAIKDAISEQRPEYRDGLKAYAKNKTEIKEIMKTFGLGPNQSVDTALRKLQSVGRNNVNTNYGYRNNLLNTLDYSGDITNALAGQNFNTLAPRGLSRVLGGILGVTLNPAALLSSPRLVGEASYLAGRLNKNAGKLKGLAEKMGLTTANTAALNQKKKKN